MKKKIIIILVILATVAISGCINSPLDNINNAMPKLSQNIIEGDSNYNDAVKYINNRSYAVAEEKANLAISQFNEGQNQLLEINKYTDDLNETVFLQYINLLEQEIKLKQNATKTLKLAIDSFKSGSTTTANSYVDSANSLMNQGISIQKEREALVQENSNKFH